MDAQKKIFAGMIMMLILPVLVFSAATLLPTTKINTEMILSRYGSTGDEVVQIQKKLKELGLYNGNVDGIFGTSTQKAVENFQRANGLAVDGIAGKDTLAKLLSNNNSDNTGNGGGDNNGNSGGDEQTIQVQTLLKKLGFYMGTVDGISGKNTKRAIQAFQRSKGLSPDGIVGKDTLSALLAASDASADGEADLELLARIISAESRGEPYEGQIAVGAVIMNRIKHPSFPNSLAGVIYQPGAFTAIVDGQFNKPVAAISRRAAHDALAGMDTSGGAVYYYNPKTATNKWIRTRPIIKTIGSHVFCE